MSKSFLSFRVKYMIRSCAFVLCAILMMNGEKSMAAAPVFQRHSVDTTVCSESVSLIDLRSFLVFADMDLGQADTLTVSTGPTSLSATSGGVGTISGFGGGNYIVTSAGAANVIPAGVLSYDFGANSYGVRTFTIKVSDGTNYDSVVVLVRVRVTPQPIVTGVYNSVHVGSTITLGGTYSTDTLRYGTTITHAWSTSSASIATISGAVTVGGASVGTATISYGATTGTCGAANTKYGTYTVTVLSNVPPAASFASGAAFYPGQTINLSGNFVSAPSTANYTVFFGAVKGIVNSVSTGSMSVTVPAGATYGPIHILDNVTQLSAYVRPGFTPTHNTNGLIPSTDTNFYGSLPTTFIPSPGSLTSGGKPYSVEYADFDGDGKSDVVMCGTGMAKAIVFRNTSTYGVVNTSSFATPDSFTVGASPISVKVADLDGDGKLDIITANVGTAGLSFLRNISTGVGDINFAPREEVNIPGIVPDELAIADYNNDGRPDIAVIVVGVRTIDATYFPTPLPTGPIATELKVGRLVIVKNNFNRAPGLTMAAENLDTVTVYRFDTSSSPISLAAADFNNDGLVDIAVSNQTKRSVAVFKNNSTTSTTSFVLQTQLSTAYNSGSTGLAVCTNCTPVRGYDYSLYNTGYPEQVRVGDIDNDGNIDIVVASTDSDLLTTNEYNAVAIFRNATPATFSFGSATTLSTNNAAPVGVAISDITGDGKPEIVITNSGNGSLSIFKNNSSSGSITSSAFIRKDLNIPGGAFAGPVCVAVGDVDGNTTKEIAVVTRATNRLFIYRSYPRPDTTPIVGDSVLCDGGSTTLHSHTMAPASSNPTSKWSVISDGTPNISFTGTTTDTVVTIHGDAPGTDTIVYTTTALGDTNYVKYVVRVSSIASAGTIYVNAIGNTSDSVCVGSNVTLVSTNPGGTWSSTSTSAVTVNAGTGVAGGVAAGSSVISYTVAGCASASTKTIRAIAAPNAGGTVSATTTTLCPTNTSRVRLAPIAQRGGTWVVRGSVVSITSSYATTDSVEVTASASAGTARVVYIVSNDCGADSASVTLTVNSSNNAGSITPTNDSMCVTGAVGLTNATGTSGTWSVVSGPASLSATTGSSVSLNGTGIAGGVAVVAYSVSSTCLVGSSSVSLSVVVSPVPAHVSVSANPRLCVSGPTVLHTVSPAVGPGITTRWSVANPTFSTVNTSGVETGLSTGINTIYYTQENICATLVDSSIKDTISVTPTADVITGASNVCAGFSLTLTASASLGTYDTRTWSSSVPSVATVTAAGVVGGAASGTTDITTTINGCTSVTSLGHTVTVDVTVPTGSISGTTHICSGSNTVLTFSGTGGSASSWSATPGVALSGPSAAAVTVTPSTVSSGFRVDTITYTSVSACGNSITIHLDTTFANPTAGVINGPATSPLVDSVCQGGTFGSYAVTVSGSSTISITSTAWSTVTPSIATVSGTGTSATVFGATTTGGNTFVQFKVTSQYCGSDSVQRAVKVKPRVTAGTVTGPLSLCYGATSLMNTTGTTGGTWRSLDFTKAIVTGSTGAIVAVYNPGPGANPRTNVVVRYTVTGYCNADSAQTNQVIDGIPNISNITTSNPSGSAGLDSVCFGGSLTQKATPSSVGFPTAALSQTWSTVTGNLTIGSATNTDTLVITGTTVGIDTVVYRVFNSCGADTAKRQIRILPPPLESHIVAPDRMCLGQVDTFYGVLSNGDTVAGIWSYMPGSTGDNVFVEAFTGKATANLAGSDVVKFTPVAGYCGSDTSTKLITVVLNPNPGTISGDTTLCVGVQTTLVNTPGVGDYWYSSDATIASVDSATGVVTGVLSGNAVIYYVDTNSCGAASSSHDIRIRALAEVGYIFGQDTSCVGGTFTLSDTVAAAAGGIWSAAGGVTVDATGLVTAVTPGLGVVTYTTNNDCGTNDTTFNIRVYGNPNLSSPTTVNLCDSAQLLYVSTSDTVGTTFAWTRATVTGIANPAAAGADTINEYLDNIDPALPVTATYVYTLTAHGCVSNQNVAVTVSPTPFLTSPLFDTICSGSQFVYLVTTNTAAASTTAAWTRAVVPGITPATAGSGTGNISEVLTGVPPLAYNVIYKYNLSWTGCPAHTEDVTVQVQPTPAVPQITTHSPADVCSKTYDQNFGAATLPPTGVTYTWTATGAQVWATGNTRQYSLVNFTTPGEAIVYLSATISGYQCATKDSFKVNVGTGVSDLPEVIYFNGDFVCLSNDQETYQWGWDDRATLDSTMFENETNQNYHEANPDFTNKYYWVITTHNGCMQKSYFNAPTGVKNVTASMGEVKLFPNPADRLINVEINNTAGGKYNVEVVNLLGQKLDMKDLVNNKTTFDVSDLAGGVYFVNCYRDGVKFASTKFVKN